MASGRPSEDLQKEENAISRAPFVRLPPSPSRKTIESARWKRERRRERRRDEGRQRSRGVRGRGSTGFGRKAQGSSKNTRVESKRGGTGVAMTTNYHFRPRAPQKRESHHLSAPLYLTPPLAHRYGFFSVGVHLRATRRPNFFLSVHRGENPSLSSLFSPSRVRPSPLSLSLFLPPFHHRSLCRVRPATTFCRRFFASLLSLRMVGTATSLSTPVATRRRRRRRRDAWCSGFQGFQLLG